jgi:polysaccharide pyruvyl transferase WcaK-like protein
MSTSSPRIALWNASGLRNLGDRLIDEVTRRHLQRRLPKSKCITFTPWPSDYCANRLRIDLDGHWSAEGRFDAIVIGGGALITGPPFADPSAQFFLLGPYPTRFKDRTPIIWSAMCADRYDGARQRPAWRSFIRVAADRVDLCTVRNRRTRRMLEACGVRKSIALVPDVAVLTDVPARPARRSRRLRVGVAVGAPFFPLESIMQFARDAAVNLDVVNRRVVRLANAAIERAAFDEDAYVQALVPLIRRLAADYSVVLFGFGAVYGDQTPIQKGR